MSKLRILSLIGVLCSSLCFLALPLLALWVPMSSWLHNDRVTRGMLLMFLAMALTGGYVAFRHHRRPGPGACGLIGSALLVAVAWRLLPPPAGWAGLALLAASALWDRRLMKSAHAGSCGERPNA